MKHKIKHWWLAQYVRDVFTWDTGGNIQNDVLILSNGEVLAISGEIIGLYKDQESYKKGEECQTLLRKI